jgi:hypothetical protein
MNLKNTRFEPLILDMLVSFVTASDKARDLMWKAVNGPYVLVCMLNSQNIKINLKVFDALIDWLKVDHYKIEEYLCDSDNLYQLFKCLFANSSSYSAQEYLHVLNSVKLIIESSDTLARFIATSKELVFKIVKQLHELYGSGALKNQISNHRGSETSKGSSHYHSQSSSQPGRQKAPYNLQPGHNLTQILRELLEIINLLIEKGNLSAKKFVERFKLQPILVCISQLAQADSLVLLEVLCSNLLKQLSGPESINT